MAISGVTCFLFPQISLHISFLHSAINPCVHMMLDPGIRAAIVRAFCCLGDSRTLSHTRSNKGQEEIISRYIRLIPAIRARNIYSVLLSPILTLSEPGISA